MAASKRMARPAGCLGLGCLLAAAATACRLAVLPPDASVPHAPLSSLLPIPAGGGAGRHRPRGSRTARGSAAAAGCLGGGAGAGSAPRGAPTPSPAAGAAGWQLPGWWQLAALRPSCHAAADGRVSSGRGGRGLRVGCTAGLQAPCHVRVAHVPPSVLATPLSPAWRGGYLAWSTGWRGWIKGPRRCCRPARAAGWARCRCANGCVFVAAPACILVATSAAIPRAIASS